MATEPLQVEPQPVEVTNARRLGVTVEEHRALIEEGLRASAEWEAEHGPITDEERATFRAKWRAATGSEWPA